MSEWEPATEAEVAMRDALRANDQEQYFRILARTDVLLPIAPDTSPASEGGWGTWTTEGRTHVLAFTSPSALQECLAGHPGTHRRLPFRDLVGIWPNVEWWLAVNPGLPIEGYLPSWFVTQISRGDVRLPGRTLGARARIEQASSRTRAVAQVPLRSVPNQPAPTSIERQRMRAEQGGLGRTPTAPAGPAVQGVSPPPSVPGATPPPPVPGVMPPPAVPGFTSPLSVPGAMPPPPVPDAMPSPVPGAAPAPPAVPPSSVPPSSVPPRRNVPPPDVAPPGAFLPTRADRPVRFERSAGGSAFGAPPAAYPGGPQPGFPAGPPVPENGAPTSGAPTSGAGTVRGRAAFPGAPQRGLFDEADRRSLDVPGERDLFVDADRAPGARTDLPPRPQNGMHQSGLPSRPVSGGPGLPSRPVGGAGPNESGLPSRPVSGIGAGESRLPSRPVGGGDLPRRDEAGVQDEGDPRRYWPRRDPARSLGEVYTEHAEPVIPAAWQPPPDLPLRSGPPLPTRQPQATRPDAEPPAFRPGGTLPPRPTPAEPSAFRPGDQMPQRLGDPLPQRPGEQMPQRPADPLPTRQGLVDPGAFRQPADEPRPYRPGGDEPAAFRPSAPEPPSAYWSAANDTTIPVGRDTQPIQPRWAGFADTRPGQPPHPAAPADADAGQQPRPTDQVPPAPPAPTPPAPPAPFSTPAAPFSTPAEPFGTQADSFRTPADQFKAPAEPFTTPAEPFTSPADPFGTPAEPFGTAAESFGAVAAGARSAGFGGADLDDHPFFSDTSDAFEPRTTPATVSSTGPAAEPRTEPADPPRPEPRREDFFAGRAEVQSPFFQDNSPEPRPFNAFAETRSETRAETWPDVRPETRADGWPETRPETRTDGWPETRADGWPETRPETRADGWSETRPETRTDGWPETRAEAGPGTWPEPTAAPGVQDEDEPPIRDPYAALADLRSEPDDAETGHPETGHPETDQPEAGHPEAGRAEPAQLWFASGLDARAETGLGHAITDPAPPGPAATESQPAGTTGDKENTGSFFLLPPVRETTRPADEPSAGLRSFFDDGEAERPSFEQTVGGSQWLYDVGTPARTPEPVYEPEIVEDAPVRLHDEIVDAEVVPPAPAKPAESDFNPANTVEQDLYEAVQANSSDRFLSTLLLAKVLVPFWTGDGPIEPARWRTEHMNGLPHLVVFTSHERMTDRLGPDAQGSWIKFTRLIRHWPPGDQLAFAINPESPAGAVLPGTEVVQLATWATELGLGVDDPEEQPAEAPKPAPQPERRPAYEPSSGRLQVMQKPISPEQLSHYLERNYDRVSGFVHRAGEVAHLQTPEQLYNALGLGYAGSSFKPDADEAYVLRWIAYRGDLYRIPYGGSSYDAMRAMEGWVIERPPFRGNGFAPSETGDVIAEFKVDSARLPHDAELWRLRRDGRHELIARLDADGPIWRRVTP